MYMADGHHVLTAQPLTPYQACELWSALKRSDILNALVEFSQEWNFTPHLSVSIERMNEDLTDYEAVSTFLAYWSSAIAQSGEIVKQQAEERKRQQAEERKKRKEAKAKKTATYPEDDDDGNDD